MSRIGKSTGLNLLIAVMIVTGGLVLQACGGGAEKAAAPEAGEAAATEAEPAGGQAVKAAFIYVSPVGDAGWTLAHDNARLEIDKLP
ncbi:MAG: BMP family ABC transporter substrate-binding protein, partial [Acidobacteriota bacterium]|nr:BMP family ABC transporter substrate-binding protein [Acidobacteriota bacterium]